MKKKNPQFYDRNGRYLRPKERAMRDLIRAAEIAERKEWLAEHPGRKAREFDIRKPEVLAWRIAKAKEADDKMRAEFLRDHPGRFSDKAARAGIWRGPLPEHLCGLDHPFRGYEAACQNIIKWLNDYYARNG